MEDGEIGEAPDWYPYFTAAPRLGLSVPELMYRVEVLGEEHWLNWAYIVQGAENYAKQELERRNASD